MFLLLGSDNREWTCSQAWSLVRNHETLLGDAFKSDGEKALAALEQAELITV